MPSLSSVPCMTSNHKHCVKQVELELWLTCLCVRARTHMYVCVWGGGVQVYHNQDTQQCCKKSHRHRWHEFASDITE